MDDLCIRAAGPDGYLGPRVSAPRGLEDQEPDARPIDAAALPARDGQRLDAGVRRHSGIERDRLVVDGSGDHHRRIHRARQERTYESAHPDLANGSADHHAHRGAAWKRSLPEDESDVVRHRGSLSARGSASERAARGERRCPSARSRAARAPRGAPAHRSGRRLREAKMLLFASSSMSLVVLPAANGSTTAGSCGGAPARAFIGCRGSRRGVLELSVHHA